MCQDGPALHEALHVMITGNADGETVIDLQALGQHLLEFAHKIVYCGETMVAHAPEVDSCGGYRVEAAVASSRALIEHLAACRDDIPRALDWSLKRWFQGKDTGVKNLDCFFTSIAGQSSEYNDSARYAKLVSRH